jgi:Tol biopolymer transport system component
MSDRGGEMDIYVFDTDTSAIRRVTTPGEVEYGVTWSPDGQYLYFVRYKEFDQNIWRIKPDGTGLEKITEGEHQRNILDISPDGKRMLISSRRENPQGELYTMDIDGKNVKRITENKFFEVGGAYSPDGKTLAIAIQIQPSPVRTWMGNAELYLYDADGKELKRLTTTDSTLEALPDFSPDGKKLAYHAFEHGKAAIVVMDLATGKATNLTKDDRDSRWPRWSPDGKWIAYTRTGEKGTDIWIMHPDGSDRHAFIVGPGREEIACFGPKMVKIPGE